MKHTTTPQRARVPSVLRTTLLSLAWLLLPQAAAGIATFDLPAPDPSWTSDLSSLTLGEAVSTLTFTSNLEVFETGVTSDSNFNEITSEGVWRLQGGATTLDFGRGLDSIWFAYRHKHNAAVVLSFFDASGGLLDSVTLDGKTAQSGTVGYDATAPGGFTSLSVTWLRAEGQWFELGPTLAATPTLAPAPASLALLGLALAGTKRRRT